MLRSRRAVALRSVIARVMCSGLLALPLVLTVPAAQAQSTNLVVIPLLMPDYARGRNVSTVEQPTPDFDPLGVNVGGFRVYPSLGIAAAVSNNVFLNDANKKSDSLVILEPMLRTVSNWSVHEVGLVAQGNFRRYAQEKLRDQNTYFIGANGRLDVTREIKLSAQYQIGKSAETPYASDLLSNVSVLSQNVRKSALGRVERQVGRTRLVATAEHVSYTFNTLQFEDGSTRDQKERDRVIDRGAVQVEYALSPSIALYAQAQYDDTRYGAARTNGLANRDSDALLLIGGVSFDLAGLARGVIGAGYVQRDYKSALYRDVSGLSIQSQVELFVSPLTTVALSAQQVIQDVNLGNSGAYRDTRIGLKVDHALLRNLILSPSVAIADRKLFETPSRQRFVSAGFTADYKASRTLQFGLSLQYTHVRPSGALLGVPFTELSGQIGIRVRR